MAPPFSYQRLPERSIRVIKLLPSRRPTDALRCNILNVHLDHVASQPYEALSYVWGELTRQWPLDCDGKELLVTRNCHEALVSLRPRYLPRTLWIDAICIDQAGTPEATAERNGQVSIMGEVYFKSSRVLIWLGPGSGAVSNPVLFRYLRSLHLLSILEIGYPRLAALLEPVTWRLLDLNHGRLVKNKSSPILESLIVILNNPWFERVWTLQEVAFGRKCIVMQGSHALNWESLCLGYLAIPTRGLNRRAETDRLLSRWRLYLALRGRSIEAIPKSRFQGESQAEAELRLLAEIRNMKATIPHDRIYSLYALFQAMGIALPSPDYNKDIAAVFEEAVVSYIRCRQNMAIITLTSPPAEASGFPSWVPDWLTPGHYAEPLIWKLADFDAQPPITMKLTLTQETGNGRLGVMAKRLGIIKKLVCCPLVGESGLPRDAVYREFVQACSDWRRFISSGLTGHPYAEKNPRQIEAALLQAYHHAIPGDNALGPWYRWLRDGRRGAKMPVANAFLIEVAKRRRPTARWFIYVLDTGYCGVAGSGCVVGDAIALLPSLHPLVLRARPSSSSAGAEYRVVTPAYCEGVINGKLSTRLGELEETVLV
ncbi:heterokaryon incompatibility protein-domain-containing protein [Corynascus novoguineensis]|uniref:Heterokaryon incompatibility protein-domain-containing protein n=1 Tax=Corynascus novoguineensis TaxID=1126955 RepID=A0AAN7CRG1_9PEZI|nr:heterokaryon incompatibility protein-domain-containing protein [Corynascus novoguineensis]